MSMNEALREHTTSIGFCLTLSKRQIDLLVALDHFKSDMDALFNWQHAGGRERERTFSHLVPTAKALESRGLIPIARGKWKLTKAGRLTVSLLKEAGIYQDRVNELGLAVEEKAA